MIHVDVIVATKHFKDFIKSPGNLRFDKLYKLDFFGRFSHDLGGGLFWKLSFVLSLAYMRFFL